MEARAEASPFCQKARFLKPCSKKSVDVYFLSSATRVAAPDAQVLGVRADMTLKNQWPQGVYKPYPCSRECAGGGEGVACFCFGIRVIFLFW